MYIWIFLATVMVALSFLNLSQRPDKDNTLSEIKAASVVNKFKAEHTAMVKTMECEIILHRNTNSWYSSSVPYSPTGLNFSGDGAVDLDYTSYTDNLPIGYESGGLEVKHYMYCFKEQVETSTSNELVSCLDTNYDYVYAVSYVQIPVAWLSKGEEGTPLPTLINLLSKSTASTSGTIYGVGTTTVYGWTECDGGSEEHLRCKLLGNNARVGLVNNSKSKTGQYLTYDILDEDSMMWKNNADFATECAAANTPCLFAYDHIRRIDNGNHCQKLVSGEYGS